MKKILFFLVIAGLLITFYIMNQSEGFQDSGLNIPLAGPPVAQLPGDAQPFDPPSTTLLAPPPGQIASVGSKPYEDPAMQKASANSINNAYVTLKGFLENEAPNIQSIGDPAIQLPLSTARGDVHRLNDEMLVLKRNPGIEATVTVGDLNAIQANLGYLQKKWRSSVHSADGAEQGKRGILSKIFSYFEGFQDAPVDDVSGADEAAEKHSPPSAKTPATLNELKDLSIRIAAEIVRLNASGTTDTVTQQRVSTLTELKTKVDDIVAGVTNGTIPAENISLTTDDINSFLPIMTSPNNPIASVMDKAGLNPGLQNLLQGHSGGDLDSAKMNTNTINAYIDLFLKNMSWKLDITYTGQAEQDAMQSESKAFADLVQIALNSKAMESVPDSAPPSTYPGQFQALTKSMEGSANPAMAAIVDQNGMDQNGMQQESQAPLPTPYDWKPRTKQICQQIAARGLNPADFGCVDPSSVSNGFSWRGNAKMICGRLSTLYDTSIPAASGCPPPSWPGWRA